MKKIVHTADWHLGARFGNRNRLDEQRRFLEWLRGLLRRERPDLLVVSGDVFDTGAPSNEALAEYYRFLKDVHADGSARHVAVVAGNHDSPALLGAPKPVLEEVGAVVVPEAAETPEGIAETEAFALACADGGRLALAAVPFLRGAELSAAARAAGVADDAPPSARLDAGFRAHCAAVAAAARAKAPAGSPLVLAAHASFAGASPSDDVSERMRRAVGGLDEIGLDALPDADYVALGHYHVHQAVGGRDTVRYAGAPIPMSFSEAVDPEAPEEERRKRDKGVVVVEFEDGAVRPRFEPYRDAQEFWRIRGTVDEVERTLRARLAAHPDSTAWIEATLAKGGGDSVAFRQMLREAVRDSSVTLAVVRAEDDGARRAALADAAGRDLSDFTPMSLAERRLKALGLEPAQIREYLGLLAKALDPGTDGGAGGEAAAEDATGGREATA